MPKVEMGSLFSSVQPGGAATSSGGNAAYMTEEQAKQEQAKQELAKQTAMGMKKGGTASSRADGIAQRGKTKGRMIMCGGGMARSKK